MRTTAISIEDLAIIYYNTAMALKQASIGSLEPAMTKDELLSSLSPIIKVPTEVVESGLYYCNLMAENKKFWHPRTSFTAWTKERFKSFNLKYNYFE